MTPTSLGALLIQPTDSGNGFVEIKLEEVEMVHNFTTIIHVVELDAVQEVIDALAYNIKQLKSDNEGVLTGELTKITLKLHTIFANRQKRGLFNAIGTGLKWITGSMNDDDRVEIEEHFKISDENNHNIIDKVNKNIIVNNHFNNTFNKLKETIEKDRRLILVQLNDLRANDNNMLSQIAYLDMLFKIKILEDSIEHIQNNIVSARLNFMSSNILTNEEINTLNIDFDKLQNIQLAVAKYKEKKILFVIKVPKDIVTVRRSLLIPMANESFVELNFKPQQVVYYQNNVFEYMHDNNINNLRKSKICIYDNNCKKVKNTKLEIIEIEKGLILIKNAFHVNLTSNCDEREIVLSRNYLLTFYDCKININNEMYSNLDKKFKENFVIPFGKADLRNKVNNEEKFDEIILEKMENIEQIKELRYHKIFSNTNIELIITVLVGVAIIVILLIFTCIIQYRKIKRSAIQNTISHTGDIMKIIEKYQNPA